MWDWDLLLPAARSWTATPGARGPQIGWVAPAAQAPAPLQVNIVEWDVPQGKLSFVPHDPDVAPDGGAWYTGYGANVLGRVDPASGQVKEFSLPTADSGPHGLTDRPAGPRLVHG